MTAGDAESSHCYLLAKDCALVAFPAPLNVWFTVSSDMAAEGVERDADADAQAYSSFVVASVVTAGLPCRFEMTSISLEVMYTFFLTLRNFCDNLTQHMHITSFAHTVTPCHSFSIYFSISLLNPLSISFSLSLSLSFSLSFLSQATKPCQDITATVTRFTVVPDLTFKFFDHAGNEAKTNKCRSWEMKITLTGGTAAVAEAKVKISSTGTMTLPLKFTKALELLERGQADGDIFTLQVASFFTMPYGKIQLQEGSIHCTQVRLNTVTSVLLSLIRDSTSSKQRKRRKGRKGQEEEV